MKQEDTGAHKVFDVEHIDLIGSASAHLNDSHHGEPTQPLGHGDAQYHRGSGNGVVTTFIPSPVTGEKDSHTFSPVPLVLSRPYHFDAGQIQFNHAVPPVEFPDFDGSSSKLWVKNCENYFDLYAVPDSHKSKIA